MSSKNAPRRSIQNANTKPKTLRSLGVPAAIQRLVLAAVAVVVAGALLTASPLTGGVDSMASSAPPDSAGASPTDTSVPPVVASTTWTAVIARAAGATDISVLAPAELRHPPEYDFKASDIAKVAGSAVLVWGGYEPFILRLIQAAGVPEERVVQIITVNTPDDLRSQSRLLSERLDTMEAQKAWEQEFDRLAAEIRSRAEASGVGQMRVLAHFHQQAFARWLGYDVVQVFGPDELSPAKVAELAQLEPDLIIDNYHNPQGRAIEEIAGCQRVELMNFPARGVDTVEMLLLDNAGKLGLTSSQPSN